MKNSSPSQKVASAPQKIKTAIDPSKKLEKLYSLVKESSRIFDAHEKVHDLQTWDYHVLPVIKNALKFAEMYGADPRVVEIAALFHDYASFVDADKYAETHHVASGELAEPILVQYGYSPEFIQKVKRCIFTHRASVLKEKATIEEVCVADADAVTHIENVFEIIMWMGQRGSGIKEGSAFVKRKITKSYAKLSPKSKEYIKDKYEAALKVFYD